MLRRIWEWGGGGKELTIHGPDLDLHSGMLRRRIDEPPRCSAKVIASLHDGRRSHTVPEFYDGRAELPTIFRAQWQGPPLITTAFLGDVGLFQNLPASRDRMRSEYDLSSPTCEVNGMWEWLYRRGFQRPFCKVAGTTQISFRLVAARKTPTSIRESFRRLVTDMSPKTVHELPRAWSSQGQC